MNLTSNHFKIGRPAAASRYEVQTALKWLKEAQSGENKEPMPNPSVALVLLAGRKVVARVDASDFPRVSQHRWKLVKSGNYFYVQANSCGQKFYLHRFILPVEGNIRFLDGNPLNCTKANLVVKAEVNHV